MASSSSGVRLWRTAFLTLRDETLASPSPPALLALLRDLMLSHSSGSLVAVATDLPPHEVISDLVLLAELASSSSACQDADDVLLWTCRLFHDVSCKAFLDISTSSWTIILNILQRIVERTISNTDNKTLNLDNSSKMRAIAEMLDILREFDTDIGIIAMFLCNVLRMFSAKAKIQPIHGSLLLYGNLFRYTPYQGFFGSDSFSYTISDANKNIATAMVSIFVLCKPPQFVSLPTGLHVIEDIISPKFGGFSGFEIMYSDINQNISLAIRAQSGNVFFSPIRMQLQQPLRSLFLVNRAGKARKEMIISSYVETINSALQYVQYISNVNFYGNDIITLHAMNEHGAQEALVPVFVEPINDPPTITAPKFISLIRKEGSNGLNIFDKQRDVFDFSVVDPDIFNFSGNKSHFILILSMEVNDGTISTTLPVGLINAAELKILDSNQWQPLQTFVTLSNHFVIEGKGIRFRGTISECNNGLQQLYYQGTGNDAVLTVTVNDLGNYGCCNDCLEMMSVPLYREITVNLIRRKPANRMEVFVLASAIVVEMIMMLLLGGVLLFFICKCLNALQRERTDSCVDATISSEGNMAKQTCSNE